MGISGQEQQAELRWTGSQMPPDGYLITAPRTRIYRHVEGSQLGAKYGTSRLMSRELQRRFDLAGDIYFLLE